MEFIPFGLYTPDLLIATVRTTLYLPFQPTQPTWFQGFDYVRLTTLMNFWIVSYLLFLVWVFSLKSYFLRSWVLPHTKMSDTIYTHSPMSTNSSFYWSSHFTVRDRLFSLDTDSWCIDITEKTQYYTTFNFQRLNFYVIMNACYLLTQAEKIKHEDIHRDSTVFGNISWYIYTNKATQIRSKINSINIQSAESKK